MSINFNFNFCLFYYRDLFQTPNSQIFWYSYSEQSSSKPLKIDSEDQSKTHLKSTEMPDGVEISKSAQSPADEETEKKVP